MRKLFSSFTCHITSTSRSLHWQKMNASNTSSYHSQSPHNHPTSIISSPSSLLAALVGCGRVRGDEHHLCRPVSRGCISGWCIRTLQISKIKNTDTVHNVPCVQEGPTSFFTKTPSIFHFFKQKYLPFHYLPTGLSVRNKISPRWRRNDMPRQFRPLPVAVRPRWLVDSTSSIRFLVSIL